MTKFSVVIPSYNSEKYIAETVESVINQEYVNWELIIIDDGSTDESGVICDQYAIREKRIRVIHTKNNGEYVSRINGMKAATGEYILCCDSDDFLGQDCLKTLNSVIEQMNVDVIIYKLSMFGAEEGEIGFPVCPYYIFETSESILAVLKSTNHSLCNKVIRSSAVKKAIAEMMPQRLDICADYAMVIPILCNTRNGVYIDKVLYHYRIYESSMSHNITIQHLINIEDSTRLIVRALNEYGMFDLQMRQAVYNAYLKALSGRCYMLMCRDEMKQSAVDYIHESELYVNSRRYERKKYFTIHSYTVLKVFRYKLFGVFKIYLCVKKKKQQIMSVLNNIRSR
ncbi:MAG: glycosyltransferase family 2 protein [Lachnospiraceae bacterium]|jgi:glycosyltransferase involved in cell wall biosynthesis|nr:glycosyltransferase family 2 protein [Lachnospiraceae bacterium]